MRSLSSFLFLPFYLTMVSSILFLFLGYFSPVIKGSLLKPQQNKGRRGNLFKAPTPNLALLIFFYLCSFHPPSLACSLSLSLVFFSEFRNQIKAVDSSSSSSAAAAECRGKKGHLEKVPFEGVQHKTLSYAEARLLLGKKVPRRAQGRGRGTSG